MTDEFDPFKPVSGLKSDFDAYIIDANFAPGDFGTSIILMTDDDDYPVRYSLGSGWETYDGGHTVSHPTDRGFRGGTQYSQFIVHAMEAGAKEIMYERNKMLNNEGPRHASLWVDLGFHWDMVAVPTRVPQQDADGNRVKDDRGRDIWLNTTVDRLLPTRFLGVKGSKPTGAVPAPAANTSDPFSVLDQGTQEKVRAAGEASGGDYLSFMDAMLELTDSNENSILDVDEIKMAVSDEAWFESWYASLT